MILTTYFMDEQLLSLVTFNSIWAIIIVMCYETKSKRGRK